MMKSHPGPWSTENAVHFYSSHRNSVGEVYASEKKILTLVLKPEFSILDLGCAAGGFYRVLKSFEPTISYTRVDISHVMIRKALLQFPGIPFLVTEGSTFPFQDQSFDLVYCSGAHHLSEDWREILREGWRVTKKYFIFDIRKTETIPTLENIQVSYEKIAFNNNWDEVFLVPGIIVNVNDFMNVLASLDLVPVVQRVYGYYYPVSAKTVSPEHQVYRTMCCLGKVKNKTNVIPGKFRYQNRSNPPEICT